MEFLTCFWSQGENIQSSTTQYNDSCIDIKNIYIFFIDVYSLDCWEVLFSLYIKDRYWVLSNPSLHLYVFISYSGCNLLFFF